MALWKNINEKEFFRKELKNSIKKILNEDLITQEQAKIMLDAKTLKASIRNIINNENEEFQKKIMNEIQNMKQNVI